MTSSASPASRGWAAVLRIIRPFTVISRTYLADLGISPPFSAPFSATPAVDSRATGDRTGLTADRISGTISSFPSKRQSTARPWKSPIPRTIPARPAAVLARWMGPGARYAAPARVPDRSEGAPAFFSISQPCPTCNGEGSVIDKPCRDCSGSGIAKKKQKIKVTIPPGVDDGKRVTIPGQGRRGTQRRSSRRSLCIHSCARPRIF